MEHDEYGNLFRLESFYWWFVARRKLVHRFLEATIGPSKSRLAADLGCGTGGNIAALSDFGKPVCLDSSPEALEFCRRRDLKRLVASDIERIALQTESVDVATALDVLEHTDDDMKSMRELARILKPGGTLLITVPAYGFLWSEHDEALHHRRRYSSHELRNKIAVCGLDLVRITHFITLLFFPIFAIRVLQNIFKKSVSPKTSHVILPGWINSLLIGLLAFERFICVNWINLPFGVTIVAIARKPAGGKQAGA